MYSCEWDPKWFQTLKERVKSSHASNITPIQCDVLSWIGEKKWEEIEVVICDPTCSGSGLNQHKDKFIQECWNLCVNEISPLSDEGAHKEYSKWIRKIS